MTRLARIACAIACAAVLVPAAAAQTVEARAASITGQALLTMNGAPAVSLMRGGILSPGDILDTRPGGRVVIEISDGSLVVVDPGSLLIIKDYRSATSLRELFEITLGRVRVKINHIGGRPNPYRMNSPTASIAVRGTEFGVSVTDQGETQVVVYEGAVEVTSLSDPDRRILIEAGRGVVVRANQPFSYINPAPVDSDDNGREHHAAPPPGQPGNPPPGQPGNPPGGPLQPAAASPAKAPPTPNHDHDENSPRIAAGTYERYLSGLSEVGQIPFLLRFNAFPDGHLDSLENPAYATTFSRAEGRLLFLPSMNGFRGLEDDASIGPVGTAPTNYALSAQTTYFAPLPGKFVAGGAFTVARLSSASGATDPDHSLGSNISNFFTGSAILARRFGENDRNSLGVSLERLSGNGTQHWTQSDIDQTRLTAGYTRDFGLTQKLGVFYRYGFIGASDGNPVPGQDMTTSNGHTAEVGARLRGALGSRWFYGIEANWLGLSLQDGLTRDYAPASHQRDYANRETLGIGLGYALGRHSILSLDTALGQSHLAAQRGQDLTGQTLQTDRSDSQFVSAHIALQTDLTRHLFLTASYMNVWQSHSQAISVFADSFGGLTPLNTPFFSLAAPAYQSNGHYSDFGAGWRFRPDLFVQYVYSTDYGRTAASHMVMLRYTFHPKGG